MRKAKEKTGRSLPKLGIVLDPLADQASRTVFACLLQSKAPPHDWHVHLNPAVKPNGYANMFLPGVFLLSWLASDRLSRARAGQSVPTGPESCPLLASALKAEYRRLAQYWVDVRGAKENEDRLRQRIGHDMDLESARHLLDRFPSSGSHQTAEIRAHSGAAPRDFLFWTRKDFERCIQREFLDGILLDAKTVALAMPLGPGTLVPDLVHKINSETFAEQWRDIRDRHGFQYLYHLDEVLTESTSDEDEDPRIFRPKGPTRADFEQKRIVPRLKEKAVRDFWKDFQKRSLGLICGEGGSGKTVLVLELAREAIRRRYKYVWFLQCGRHTDIDSQVVAVEIRSVRGLLVIEDAHLWAEDVDSLCRSIHGRNDLAVLLVARPSLVEQLQALDKRTGPPSFLNILRGKALRLAASTDVSANITEHFREKHSDLPWSDQHKKRLQLLGQENYWILKLALLGYASQGEKGHIDPETWLRRGVQSYIDYVGRDMPGADREYPQILVGLAALGQEEVMTHEFFLADRLLNYMGVKRVTALLDGLLRHGEVTQSRTTAGRFYTLPHPTLAAAIWKHGILYLQPALRKNGIALRNGYEREDFCYEYAVTGSPNGLEAIVRVGGRDGFSILERLKDSKVLAELILADRSRGRLFELADLWASYIFQGHTEVAYALAQRMEGATDLADAAFLLKLVHLASPDAAEELCKHIDVEVLVHTIDRASDMDSAGELVGRISLASPDKGRVLVNDLDMRVLARKLGGTCSMESIGTLLDGLYLTDDTTREQLCRNIDWDMLVRKMRQPGELDGAGHAIEGLWWLCRTQTERMIKTMDLKALARRIDEDEDPDSAGPLLGVIKQVDRGTAQRLWGNLAPKSRHAIEEIEEMGFELDAS